MTLNFRTIGAEQTDPVSTRHHHDVLPAVSNTAEIRNFTDGTITVLYRTGVMMRVRPQAPTNVIDAGCVIFHNRYRWDKDKVEIVHDRVSNQNGDAKSSPYSSAARTALIGCRSVPTNTCHFGTNVMESENIITRVSEKEFRDSSPLYITEMDVLICPRNTTSVPTHPHSRESSMETSLDALYEKDRNIPISHSMFLSDPDGRYPPLYGWLHDDAYRIPVISDHLTYGEGLWIMKDTGTSDEPVRSCRSVSLDALLESFPIYTSIEECRLKSDPKYILETKRNKEEEDLREKNYQRQLHAHKLQQEAIEEKRILDKSKNQLELDSMRRKDRYETDSIARKDSNETLRVIAATIPLVSAVTLGIYRLYETFR